MDVFKTLILDTPDSLSNISGVLPVVNGGTGADNASDARVNLLPDYTGNANKVLSLNGTATDVEWTSNGAGDVAGPASSTDNAVARFDSTTGKVIQNSGVTISDANLLTADALSINNDTTLGSSHGDDVTFNARIASEFTPATDNTYDLGRTGHEWRNLYLDGTANIDSLVADTADINGGTIDGTTIGATTPSTGAFTSVAVGTDAAFGATLGQFNGANVAITNTAGQFSVGTTDTAAADLGGSLGFTANTTTLAGYPMGSISGRLIATGAGVYRSYMAFATTDAAGSVAERMRLTDTGLDVTGAGTFTNSANDAGSVAMLLQNSDGNSGIGSRLAWRLDNLANEWGYINVNRVGGGATAQMDFAVNDAAYTGSPSVAMTVLGSGNVGIGTASPAHKLTVSEASTDFAALISNSTSSGNGLKINAGDNSGDSILQLNDKDGNGKMRVLATGNVGIGTTSPAYQLQLSTDSAAKPSTNTWTIVSDARIKTETGEYTKGLDAVLSLRPVTYRYNGKAGMVDDGEDKISIIAQEAINAFPECVGSYMTKLDEEDEEETEVLNWNGHALTFALVNSIKELTARLEALETN